MISTAPPFVLRLSKDERRVFQQNEISTSTVTELNSEGSFAAGVPGEYQIGRILSTNSGFRVQIGQRARDEPSAAKAMGLYLVASCELR